MEGVLFLETRILADSSCELNKDRNDHKGISTIPFKLYTDGKEYVDDDQLDVAGFVQKMRASADLPRSACPSPHDFMAFFQQAKTIFMITISAALSGTFNSAQMAKKMYLEEYPDAKVHVFDSKSASTGETLIAMKVKELIKEGLDFSSIVQQVENYIGEQKTFFIAESLDNLMKNGRISKIRGRIATALNIKPIMGSTPEGNIQLVEKVRGSNKAFKRLVDLIQEIATDTQDRILAISHCDNKERAQKLKEEIEKRCCFKEIIVLQTGGLSSLYVDYKGIILSF